MTRKDYIALATALYSSNATLTTCLAVAEVLANDNERFDFEKFVDKAYWEGRVVK